jgi:N-glycosylase/DNA lyase
MNELKDLQKTYQELTFAIEQKYLTFQGIWELGDKEIFPELVFCLCTPQSKAQSGWKATQEIFRNGLIAHPSEDKIADILSTAGVRFKTKKAKYIVEAIRRFGRLDFNFKEFIASLMTKNDVIGTRNWFAENVKGMGMKEASHFLRNIGLGDEICILDRHILRSLESFGVIRMPKAMKRQDYLDIELEMKKFSKEIKIPVFALDFVFWADTHKGELFK